MPAGRRLRRTTRCSRRTRRSRPPWCWRSSGGSPGSRRSPRRRRSATRPGEPKFFERRRVATSSPENPRLRMTRSWRGKRACSSVSSQPSVLQPLGQLVADDADVLAGVQHERRGRVGAHRGQRDHRGRGGQRQPETNGSGHGENPFVERAVARRRRSPPHWGGARGYAAPARPRASAGSFSIFDGVTQILPSLSFADTVPVTRAFTWVVHASPACSATSFFLT